MSDSGDQSSAAPSVRGASRQMALALGAIGAVASQAALLTALLYYVGWARANATFDEFGIDPGVVGYGTEDYVLRSINATFPALIVCTFVGLLLLLVHHSVVLPLVEQCAVPTRRVLTRRVIMVGMACGVVLALLVCIRLAAFDILRMESGLMLPGALIASVILISSSAICVPALKAASHLTASTRKFLPPHF